VFRRAGRWKGEGSFIHLLAPDFALCRARPREKLFSEGRYRPRGNPHPALERERTTRRVCATAGGASCNHGRDHGLLLVRGSGVKDGGLCRAERSGRGATRIDEFPFRRGKGRRIAWRRWSPARKHRVSGGPVSLTRRRCFRAGRPVRLSFALRLARHKRAPAKQGKTAKSGARRLCTSGINPGSAGPRPFPFRADLFAPANAARVKGRAGRNSGATRTPKTAEGAAPIARAAHIRARSIPDAWPFLAACPPARRPVGDPAKQTSVKDHRRRQTGRPRD